MKKEHEVLAAEFLNEFKTKKEQKAFRGFCEDVIHALDEKGCGAKLWQKGEIVVWVFSSDLKSFEAHFEKQLVDCDGFADGTDFIEKKLYKNVLELYKSIGDFKFIN